MDKHLTLCEYFIEMLLDILKNPRIIINILLYEDFGFIRIGFYTYFGYINNQNTTIW